MRNASRTAALLFAGFLSVPVLAQELVEAGPSPYEFTTQKWMQPFAGEGFTGAATLA